MKIYFVVVCYQNVAVWRGEEVFCLYYGGHMTWFWQMMFVSTSASDGLERLISEMTYNVLMGTLNPTHSDTVLLHFSVWSSDGVEYLFVTGEQGEPCGVGSTGGVFASVRHSTCHGVTVLDVVHGVHVPWQRRPGRPCPAAAEWSQAGRAENENQVDLSYLSPVRAPGL